MYGIGDFCVFLGLVQQGSELIAERVEKTESGKESCRYYRNNLYCYKLLFQNDGEVITEKIGITQKEYDQILEENY